MKKIAFILLVAMLLSLGACTKSDDSKASDSAGNAGGKGEWTNATETIECADASVQFSYDNSYSYKAEYALLPSKLDLSAIAAQNYDIKIDVTYEVYYVKDFDVPFDIGYLGAPDHDALIVNAYDEGTSNKDLPTSTTATAESISLVTSAKNLLNNPYYLRLITYNLQNIVHFKNIKITFTCIEKN